MSTKQYRCSDVALFDEPRHTAASLAALLLTRDSGEGRSCSRESWDAAVDDLSATYQLLATWEELEQDAIELGGMLFFEADLRQGREPFVTIHFAGESQVDMARPPIRIELEETGEVVEVRSVGGRLTVTHEYCAGCGAPPGGLPSLAKRKAITAELDRAHHVETLTEEEAERIPDALLREGMALAALFP
jgi:hypothetical protein